MNAFLPPASATDAEAAHTTSRKSARSPTMELIVRGERRRVWTVEQKREIVSESLGPDLTPSEVARKHGIGSGLLYTWRRQLLVGRVALLTRSGPQFAQVEIAETPVQPATLHPEPTEVRSPLSTHPSPVLRHPEGLIEVVLPSGISVRVDAQVDAQALRRVLDALRGA
jgi:transposase